MRGSSTHAVRSLVLVAIACSIWTTAAAAAAPLSMSVTPAGVVTLRLGDRTVATGSFHLRFDSYIDAPGAAAQSNPGDVLALRGSQATPAHAVVHEDHANGISADVAYDLHGEDLVLTAHVANADRVRTVRPVAFYGLTFHFDPARHVTGEMGVWYWTYLQASGAMLFHPGTTNPVGFWWAADDGYGFSVEADSEFDREKFVSATWAGHDNVVPAECEPNLFTDRPVPPGSAVDVTATFRISPDRSLAHLAAPYRAIYDRRFPLPLYNPDGRMVGQNAAVGESLQSPSNPHGYNGDWRRLDSPLGTRLYCQRIIPMLVHDDAVGMIFWAPGGVTPVMYNPEFDDLPKAVVANLPSLMAAFHARGLRVGIATRPGEGIVRRDGKTAGTYRLSADDPEQMRVLLGRFRHCMDMGFDMFYMDTFGGTGLNDLRILRKIRDAVGPDVLLYSEYSTDLSLAYAGRYCEYTRDHQVRWDGTNMLRTLQMLAPRATWLCASETGEPTPKEFAPLGLTPIVGDHDLGRIPPWTPLPVPAGR